MGRHLRIASLVTLLAFSTETLAAGYILHPERRGGPTTGPIDPAVAIIDGVLLLLGIVPGVIAFAVDISNGTLYLHGGSRRRADAGGPGEALAAVPLGAGDDPRAAVARALSAELGREIAPEHITFYRADETGDLQLQVARLEQLN